MSAFKLITIIFFTINFFCVSDGDNVAVQDAEVYIHAEVSSCKENYRNYDCIANVKPYSNNHIPNPVINYQSWHYMRLSISFKERVRFTHAILHSRNYHTFMDFRYKNKGDVRIITETQNNVGRPCFIPVKDYEVQNLELGLFSNKNNIRPGLFKLIFYRKKVYESKKMISPVYIDNLAYISTCTSTDDPSGSSPSRNCLKAVDTLTKESNKLFNPPERRNEYYNSFWLVSSGDNPWFKVQFRLKLILKSVRLIPKNSGSQNDVIQWKIEVEDGSLYTIPITSALSWSEKVFNTAEFTSSVKLKEPIVRSGANSVGFKEIQYKAFQPKSDPIKTELGFTNFTDFTGNSDVKCILSSACCQDRLQGTGKSLPPQLISVPSIYKIQLPYTYPIFAVAITAFQQSVKVIVGNYEGTINFGSDKFAERKLYHLPEYQEKKEVLLEAKGISSTNGKILIIHDIDILGPAAFPVVPPCSSNSSMCQFISKRMTYVIGVDRRKFKVKLEGYHLESDKDVKIALPKYPQKTNKKSCEGCTTSKLEQIQNTTSTLKNITSSLIPKMNKYEAICNCPDNNAKTQTFTVVSKSFYLCSIEILNML